MIIRLPQNFLRNIGSSAHLLGHQPIIFLGKAKIQYSNLVVASCGKLSEEYNIFRLYVPMSKVLGM